MVLCAGLINVERILYVGLVHVEHVWCCAEDYLILNVYYV